MLGQVTNVRIGNQKLISVDSIALFGIIGLLAAIGAIMTHKFQNDESVYLTKFDQASIPIAVATFNNTCLLFPEDQCDDYTIEIQVDCFRKPQHAVCPRDNPNFAQGFLIPYTIDWLVPPAWNDTLIHYNLSFFGEYTGPNPHNYLPGYTYRNDNTDFRLIFPPFCQSWCTDTTDWMFKLCDAVAGLCVGFSALVFLYLYLGCILERLYPKRKLQRLANLLLMRGEEAPELERETTSSKSESIRPDLKEY